MTGPGRVVFGVALCSMVAFRVLEGSAQFVAAMVGAVSLLVAFVFERVARD